ncbi:MAG: thioredoxin [Deltaproteobacteria bacterium]|jgi:thioredoxin 1|nr:thioredoxin [Deltaproteobacteria bacterium]
MPNIIELTDATFDQAVTESALPILVDFWAPWCGPCLRAAPILEELSDELAGRLAFAKINVDDHNDAAVKMKIVNIPCLIIFKNGQPVKRIEGCKAKKDYLKLLETVA